jgi:hypothetical protein
MTVRGAKLDLKFSWQKNCIAFLLRSVAWAFTAVKKVRMVLSKQKTKQDSAQRNIP